METHTCKGDLRRPPTTTAISRKTHSKAFSAKPNRRRCDGYFRWIHQFQWYGSPLFWCLFSQRAHFVHQNILRLYESAHARRVCTRTPCWSFARWRAFPSDYLFLSYLLHICGQCDNASALENKPNSRSAHACDRLILDTRSAALQKHT